VFNLPRTFRSDDAVIGEDELTVENVAVAGRAVVDGVKVVGHISSLSDSAASKKQPAEWTRLP
jgi:hypothetical protein